MLTPRQVTEITEQAALANIARADLERVIVEPATDSGGNDALRITLVLRSSAIKKLSGDSALDLLVGIQQQLEKAGDGRFPLVEYATEQELVPENDQDEPGSV